MRAAFTEGLAGASQIFDKLFGGGATDQERATKGKDDCRRYRKG
jgi:hypothetical protein